MDPNPSFRAWFEFLELESPLRCLDVGALAISEQPEPWVEWARAGCAEVIGFEPITEECTRLNQQVTGEGSRIRYLPYALGDGAEHRLHVTNVPMTSSLYPPARSTIDLFPLLGELMRVEQQLPLQTHRLDDLPEVSPADFLKLDVQGAELMVLENATETLRDVAVLQCEVEFVELYEGQPLFADVDRCLRTQGFGFLRFAYAMGRPFNPLQRQEGPGLAISQTLWGDAIYVKDFRRRSEWNERILKAAAFVLHELYGAFDLVSLMLAELDRRAGTQWQECYLGSVLFSQPGLRLAAEPQP